MKGKSATDYKFKRSSQAVTLAAKSSVRVESDTVQVDPQLLFQRLIVACNRSDDLQGLFRYELCSYPVALFDSSLTLRKPQKPVLAVMLYGKSCHPMPLQGQKETFSMYWMAELYSIESRGLEGRQPIRISVVYTAAM